MPIPPQTWHPTRLVQVADSRATSMSTAEVLTDAGRAFIKPLGNNQGPHPLACEWVATHLACWFGLSTFDIALLVLDESDSFSLKGAGPSQAGPAFAARAVDGHPWSRSEKELDRLVNPDDISRLVVFDTWTLNCDRHPPDLATRKPNYDNVFLMREPGTRNSLRLMAMDHTHCFTCGRDLTGRIAPLGRIQDDAIYGLFPEFVTRVHLDTVEQAAGRLRELVAQNVTDIIATIPREWEVRPEARTALGELISRRAAFVADTIVGKLAPLCWERRA